MPDWCYSSANVLAINIAFIAVALRDGNVWLGDKF